MAAYGRHRERRNEDSADADGVDYGHTGDTADANPWALGDDRRAAWNDGWRVGTALRPFDAIRGEVASVSFSGSSTQANSRSEWNQRFVADWCQPT